MSVRGPIPAPAVVTITALGQPATAPATATSGRKLVLAKQPRGWPLRVRPASAWQS